MDATPSADSAYDHVASMDESSASSVRVHMKEHNRDGDDPDENASNLPEACIGAKESRAVRWIRVIASAVILSSTLGVALGVFNYMTSAERRTFVYRFKSDSYKILESIGSTFDRSLGAVDAFAVSMVSSAKDSNQTWPFVTLSDFPVKSSKLLSLSKGILISPYCHVTDQQRPLWNNYTSNNDWWVETSFDVQEKAFNKTYFGSLNRDWVKPRDIWHLDGAARENEFYYVGWQQYPAVAGEFPFYSWDYWFYMDSSGKRMHETHRPVITSAFNLPDPDDPEEMAYVESNAEWYRDYLPPDRDPSEPYSDILYVSYYSTLVKHCLRSPLTTPSHSVWNCSPC
jgi:hypothetical protein